MNIKHGYEIRFADRNPGHGDRLILRRIGDKPWREHEFELDALTPSSQARVAMLLRPCRIEARNQSIVFVAQANWDREYEDYQNRCRRIGNNAPLNYQEWLAEFDVLSTKFAALESRFETLNKWEKDEWRYLSRLLAI